MIEKIDSTYPVDEIVDFCKAAIDNDVPATKNLEYQNWDVKTHTLLYALYKEKRFDGHKSGYFIYKKHGKIIATCGYYPFDLDDNLYCQARGFTIKRTVDFHKLSFIISDHCFDSRKYKGGAITFEPHNDIFANKLVNVQKKRTESPYYKKHIFNNRVYQHTYKKQGTRCLPFEMYEHPVLYRNHKQTIVYHLFDENYKQELIQNLEKARIDD